MTRPPEIQYYVDACRHELDGLLEKIKQRQEEIDTLSRRADELATLCRSATKFLASVASVGDVVDFVHPDELVGELPPRKEDI